MNPDLSALKIRPRRLRRTPFLRNLVTQTYLHTNQLVAPVFVKHGTGLKNPISAMPGYFQYSVDQLHDAILSLQQLGIQHVLLFGIPAHKDSQATDSYSPNGIIQQAIRAVKHIAPAMNVITDVCFCEYTDHGHCGVLSQTPPIDVDNDSTLELLAQQAISHAQAGADVLAPSGMMDGTIGFLRDRLDAAGFSHIPLLSYAVKYASALYGPFRQAAEGAPQFGDRKTYQMNYANSQEALLECTLDVQQGADMLMVKPAHTYLDIIYQVKQAFPHIPLGAYHTSGEYSMIKAAAQNGWLDERAAVLEILTALRRAGADFIITYYAADVAKWLAEG